ncbi:MAG: hypothetical protein KC425_15320 [Anaerolineales bacterium]|nr:hypothetical protein [Anaerolineales bacterium]
MTNSVSISRRTALLVLLISVALNAGGQLFFKSARVLQPDASLVQLFLHLPIWIGLVMYGLSAVSWLWVLARAQLSYAYPILSLSYPIVVGLSAVFFGETISLLRWIGVGFIILGVSLLART